MEIPSGGIGFFDSGVGGLTVLSACLEKLSASGVFRPVLYYGDNARAPYGGREEGEIAAFAEEAFSLFDDLRVSAAVIACNTVTAVCAEHIPFPSSAPSPPCVPPPARGERSSFSSRPPRRKASAFSPCAPARKGSFPPRGCAYFLVPVSPGRWRNIFRRTHPCRFLPCCLPVRLPPSSSAAPITSF